MRFRTQSQVAAFAVLSASIFASAATAQAPRTRDRIPRDQLYFATSAEGAPQVHGRTYKAEFTADAATYTPFCGSAAPRSHPLGFRLESIRAGGEPVAFATDVAAQRAGDSVSYARGGVRELYDLKPDSIEQKFVFETLPATGELVVRIACASDMSASYADGGIEFSSADGSVRYGAATVVDARGASAPAELELDGQQIGIHVPADFLARASFPVTIDPLITTFGISWGGTTYDDFAPAVAWDETNQRYCTVMEEAFSVTDHDVIRVFSDAVGTFLAAGYIDLSSAYWAAPDVANNNNSDQFYVVAAVGDPAGGLRTIRGRTLNAATGTPGADTEISVGTSGEDVRPSVGGDATSVSTAYFTVVWENIVSPGTDTNILAQTVDQSGALYFGLTVIDNTSATLDGSPRISKDCSSFASYVVVWQRDVAPGDADIFGAMLVYDGSIQAGATPLVTAGNTTAPACSSVLPGWSWLLVYEYDYVTDHDVVGSMRFALNPALSTLNLSDREDSMGSGSLFEDQVRPAVETDGVHFSYSYSESYLGSPTDYDVYVSSLDYIGSYLRIGEFHVNLAANGTHEDYPRMCSRLTGGGSGNQMGVVWSDDTAGSDLRDVNAAVYATGDFTKMCSAAWDGVNLCPCANTSFLLGRGCENSSATGGASLDGTGDASLAVDTAVFTTFGERPTAPSILAQGTALIASGAGFGQGLRCAGGALKRMYVKIASGGSITAPSGLDLPISLRSAALGDVISPGTKRFYFVYYRDPFVLGGCPINLGFNSTDTVQVVWRP